VFHTASIFADRPLDHRAWQWPRQIELYNGEGEFVPIGRRAQRSAASRRGDGFRLGMKAQSLPAACKGRSARLLLVLQSFSSNATPSHLLPVPARAVLILQQNQLPGGRSSRGVRDSCSNIREAAPLLCPHDFRKNVFRSGRVRPNEVPSATGPVESPRR